jgi:hypothetical protein
VNVTKQQLENLYVGHGLTIRQCAEVLGLPTSGGISWRLRKYGIAARPQLQVDKFHGGAKPREKHKVIIHCTQCGKPLERFPSVTRENNFCNFACYKGWRTGNFKGEANPNYGNTILAGANNPNWQGGIACEPYAPIWVDKRFKAGIRERDGHECQNPDCRGDVVTLTCHHIDYDKKNCNPKNLITLCVSCNARANFNRDFWEAGYREIIRRKYAEDRQQIAV